MCDERRFRGEENQRRAEKEMGEMEKRLLEVEKHHEEAKTQMNEVIGDCSLAEKLCTDAEEREREGGVQPSNLPAT